MNKYQKALYEITRSVGNHGWFGRDVTDVLQELVDKETPMKRKDGRECPNCKLCVRLDYLTPRCGCGQRIDWGEEDE